MCYAAYTKIHTNSNRKLREVVQVVVSTPGKSHFHWGSSAKICQTQQLGDCSEERKETVREKVTETHCIQKHTYIMTFLASSKGDSLGLLGSKPAHLPPPFILVTSPGSVCLCVCVRTCWGWQCSPVQCWPQAAHSNIKQFFSLWLIYLLCLSVCGWMGECRNIVGCFG